MAFEVFISYSHQDQLLRTELDKHLSNLKRQNIITSWYDGDIIPGKEWEPEIMQRLKRAQIILLLVSYHPDPDSITFLFQNSLTIQRTGAEATLSGSLRYLSV
jgi:hypothetical protein